MTPLVVLKFPNPVLKQISQGVTQFDEALELLSSAMIDTMYQEGGIGLAAPQVGQLRRLIVVDVRDGLGERDYEKDEEGDDPSDDEAIEEARRNPMAMVNPTLLDQDGEIITEEGCLSVVEFTAEVKRAERIEVAYQTIGGEERREEFKGIKAVCIQHEMDHLDGKLFIDHLPPLKRQMVRKRLTKLSLSA